jgi:hypothetical protein
MTKSIYVLDIWKNIYNKTFQNSGMVDQELLLITFHLVVSK